MDKLTLNDYAAIAQIVMAIVAFVGIIISITFSIKTLGELQHDRRVRSKPHLAFEPGGYLLDIEFVKAGKKCPGLNPKFVERMFPDLPEDAESVRLKVHKYGNLRNYGAGTGLETQIKWVPNKIWFGSESFILDKNKLLEPPYCGELNTMSPIPRHILSEQESSLSRIPTFIEKDFEKKITKVEGILEICCSDIFGRNYKAYQQFYLFTDYKAKLLVCI